MNDPIAFRDLPSDLMERSAIRVIWGIVRTWLGILGMLALVAAFSSWSVWLISIFFIGTFQYHLNILGHEGIHFCLFNDRCRNDLVCRYLLHGPVLSPLKAMRRNHLHHHRRLGESDDLDRQYYGLWKNVSGTGLIKWLVSSLFGGMAFPIVLKLLRRPLITGAQQMKLSSTSSAFDKEDVRAILVTQAVIFIGIWAITGLMWAYFVLWIVPIFTSMMGLNTIRSCLEHADPETAGPDQAVFTFVPSPVETFFLSPFNMNYHIEHHAYVMVPYYRLPALHRYLVDKNVFNPSRIESSYFVRLAKLVRTVDGLRKNEV